MLEIEEIGRTADGVGHDTADFQDRVAHTDLSALGRGDDHSNSETQGWSVVATIPAPAGEAGPKTDRRPGDQRPAFNSAAPVGRGEGQIPGDTQETPAFPIHSAPAEAGGQGSPDAQKARAAGTSSPQGGDDGQCSTDDHHEVAIVTTTPARARRDAKARTLATLTEQPPSVPATDRRKATERAKKAATPMRFSPSPTDPLIAALFGDDEAQPGAKFKPTSTSDAPQVATDPAPKREGRKTNHVSTTNRAASFDPDPTLATAGPVTIRLIELARLRKHQIRLSQAVLLPTKALIRQFCGFSTFDSDKAGAKEKLERSKLIWDYFVQSQKAAVSKRTISIPELSNEDQAIARMVRTQTERSLAWLTAVDILRDMYETEMADLARSLPAAEFVASVPGLSLKALAIVTAEARGDLETFRNPARLWKRLGWANGGDNRAQAGCSKVRKADVYAAVAEPLIRAQSARIDDDGAVTRPAGAYRLLYDAARARYDALNEAGAYAERAAAELKRSPGATAAQNKLWQAGKLTPLHLHRRAIRVMLKAVLVDLWRVSRGMEPRFWKTGP